MCALTGRIRGAETVAKEPVQHAREREKGPKKGACSSMSQRRLRRSRVLQRAITEATRGGGGDFSGIDGGDHKGVTNANAGDETAKHEEGIVHGEAHEYGTGEEDGASKDNGVPTTNPVGSSSS